MSAPILTTIESPIENKTRLFFMARRRAADLIRTGELERAADIIVCLAKIGTCLLSREGSELVLGRATERAVKDLAVRYRDTRDHMAADLAAAR